MKDLHGDPIVIQPFSYGRKISVMARGRGSGEVVPIWLDADNVEKFIKKIRKAIKESNNNG